ncbi:ATP-binding cassette sub-family A member 2 [Drosophila eugracilis]|uniref:ATP-binding cassette sub-family A member 2 n=1 Tax=Drosophila eugracilis TaxID=29029 RepID=UPI0007E83E3D|nr:ATP-binding cassette sub-family A member 2 [Drosophila eugracilis]
MTVRTYIRKFVLMNWKNHKLQMANPLELLVIVLLPPLFTVLAVIMRFIIALDPRSDKVYDPIDLDRSWMQMAEKLERAHKLADEHNVKGNPFTPHLIIGWAPKSYSIFRSMMRRVQKQVDPMTTIGFEDCHNLKESIIENSLFAGICFDATPFPEGQSFEEDTLESYETIQPVLNYTILLPSELRILDGDFRMANWMTLYNDDPYTYVLLRLNQPYEGGFVGYVREGFIQLQKAVSESFLALTSHKSLPLIQVRRFPVTGRKQDPLMNNLTYGLPLLIVIGFLFPAQLFVWQVVTEKQTQVRQFLINMNIGNLIHFVSWYLKGMVYMMISSLIITVTLKIRWAHEHSVLTQTPWYVLIIVLFCYNSASIAFAIMVAAFFRNAINAVRVLTTLWIMTYVPAFILWNGKEGNILAMRYAVFALPNVVVTLVFEFLIERESIVHVAWQDFGYSLSDPSATITVTSSTWILMLDSLIYCVIGLYVDMWHGRDRSGKRMKKPNANANSVHDDPYNERADSFTHQGQAIGVNSTKIYEVEPSHRRFKLKIKKLCKRFAANDRPALNLFSWNVYENEVTVLMGHNGCGKSTLLKIVAGLVEPSRGTVMISSYNIQTERKAASMELGIAFGNEMLLTGLTVIDYLRFICRVKGLHNKIEIEGQANYFLNVLQIGDIKTTRIRKLAGRELCLVSICCAFVGNSPIILIDDIHSDLDKHTQALVWNLINEEKSKRTIILVSNSPALAENIADRMAIMSNGELKCTGTKPFLKNMYGHGYRLTCVKGDNYKTEDLYRLLTSYMPNIGIERDIGYKITFVLENKYEDQFPLLLDELEQNMKQLGVVSFRIRDTSMEEIFLRFGCEENDQSGAFQSHENTQILLEEYYAILAEANEKGRRTGWKLNMLHARAVLYKRWISSTRHWIVLVFELLATALVAVCCFSSIFVFGKQYELEPLTFNLSQLHTVDAFVELFSEEEDVKDMHAYYTELLYWYDAHVATVTRNRHNTYTLLTQSEFTSHVNSRFIFGATFDQQIVTAWFNNIPLHAAPYALNIVHNAVARHLFDEEATIDVTLAPLPFQTSINTFPPSNHSFGGCLAFAIAFVLTFIWPAFAIFMIKERGSLLKKQQFLAGARCCSYWIFTVLYDLIFLLILCVMVVVMAVVYKDPNHDIELYVFVAITVLLAGLWVNLLAYLISGLCRNPCYGFLFLCWINSLGLVYFSQVYRNGFDNMGPEPSFLVMYTMAVVICKLFAIDEYKLICMDPFVNFTSVEVYECKTIPNCCTNSNYTTPGTGVGHELILLAALIIVLGVLLIAIEYYSIVGFREFCASKKAAVQTDENQEGRSVPGQMSQDSTFRMQRYQASNMTEAERNKFAAVGIGVVANYRRNRVLNGVDFSVAKSECVSISGANNSGKSTLLKLLVNEKKMSSGQIWINGYSMRRHRIKCYQMVGYCPQRDNLPAEFTPRELLYIHALLQGHRDQIGREMSESLLRLMGLTPCWNRSVSMCTTGQIRRLYFAYAVLGSPELICVDGVPCGLDPTGKRIILMMTSTMQEMGSSFLYTMLTNLDGERLCQRTPILLEGHLWMLGSMDGQNENYKDGYQLEIRFKRKVNPNVSMSRATWNLINHFPMSPNKKFSAFMEIKFPEAVLKIEKEDSMVFQLPVGTTTFSEIFLTLRKDAFEMNIEDYFITRNMRIGLQIFTIDQHNDYP